MATKHDNQNERDCYHAIRCNPDVPHDMDVIIKLEDVQKAGINKSHFIKDAILEKPIAGASK